MRLKEKIKNCIKNHKRISTIVLSGAVLTAVLAVGHNRWDIINQGEETPENAVSVIHFGDEGTERLAAKDAFSFDTKSFSPFAFIFDTETYTKEAEGEDYKITVTYTDAAEIPEEAVLEVQEITKDSKEYARYYQKMVETMLANGDAKDEVELNIISNRFFDISFKLNGEEIEPKETVNVQIDLKKKESETDDSDEGIAAYSMEDEEEERKIRDYTIIHYTDDGKVEIPEVKSGINTEDENTVTTNFSLDSFSVVITVETDGQTIDWDHENKNQSSYWMGNIGARPRTLIIDSPWYDFYETQIMYVYLNANESVLFGSSSFKDLNQDRVCDVIQKSLGKIKGNEKTIGNPEDVKAATVAIVPPYGPGRTSINGPKKLFLRAGNSNIETLELLCSDHKNKDGSSKYNTNNVYLISREGDTGYIKTRSQEISGAKYIVEDKGYNKNGYVPYSFEAPVSGVYTFCFFGSGTGGGGLNATEINADLFHNENSSCVEAWDITVVNRQGTREKGRVFTDALQWYTGYSGQSGNNNATGLYQTVYVLTSDGFEYGINFNGIEPIYYTFYANRRGVLTTNENREQEGAYNYRSLYKSVKLPNGANADATAAVFNNAGIYINLFAKDKDKDSDIDEDYYIFFEREISDDAMRWYTGREKPATSVNALANKFTDFQIPSRTEAGQGGDFSFYYAPSSGSNGIAPVSYDIELNFGEDPVKGPNIVKIPGNRLTRGKNKVFWNGKDAFDNDVALDADLLEAACLIVKAGETHFPLIDIEGNPNGFIVERVNEIIDSGDNEENRYRVYYNNKGIHITDKNGCIIDSNGNYLDKDKNNLGETVTTPGGTDNLASGTREVSISQYLSENPLGDGQNKLETGVNSFTEEKHAMGWSNGGGNKALLDMWVAYEVRVKPSTSKFTGTTHWEYKDRNFVDEEPPAFSDVKLQFCLVNETDSQDALATEKGVIGWRENDDRVWQDYVGAVKVKLNGEEEKSFIFSEENPYIRIDNDEKKNQYETVDEKKVQTAGDGICEFSNLPKYDVESNKYYQYRIVDRRVLDGAGDRVVYYYDHGRSFNSSEALQESVEINGKNVTIYGQEDLVYKYKAEDAEIKVQQLWEDTDLMSEWISTYRPKAVQAMLLYGVQKTDTSLPGYAVETIEGKNIVWYPYHKNKKESIIPLINLKLKEDTLSEGYTYSKNGYVGNQKVKKYAPDGNPYYYKVVPVSYSMDGINFEPKVNKEGNILESTNEVFKEMGQKLPGYYDLSGNSYVYFNDQGQPVRTLQLGADQADVTIDSDTVTITDKPKTFTLELIKVSTSNVNKVLGGAEFTLKMKCKTGNEDKTVEYTYNGEKVVTEKSSEETGIFSVNLLKLPYGMYELLETKAPEGHRIGKPVIITVGFDGISSVSLGNEDINNIESTLFTKVDGKYVIKVPNSAGTLLPLTGGPGTKLYRLAGIIFLFAGAAVLILKRRRNYER